MVMRRRRRRIDAGGDGRCGDDKGAGGAARGSVACLDLGAGAEPRCMVHFPCSFRPFCSSRARPQDFFPLYGHRCHFLWSLFTVICACRPLCARGTRKGEEFSFWASRSTTPFVQRVKSSSTMLPSFKVCRGRLETPLTN